MDWWVFVLLRGQRGFGGWQRRWHRGAADHRGHSIRRHPRGRARRDAPQAAAHSGDHPRVALSAAHRRAQPEHKWETRQKHDKLETGEYREPSQQPLAQYLTGWLNGTAALTVRERTLAGYQRLLHRYVHRTTLAGEPLARLTTTRLEQHYSALGQTLSPRTVRLVHSILSNALQVAVRDRSIRSNRAAGASCTRRRNSWACCWVSCAQRPLCGCFFFFLRPDALPIGVGVPGTGQITCGIGNWWVT